MIILREQCAPQSPKHFGSRVTSGNHRLFLDAEGAPRKTLDDWMTGARGARILMNFLGISPRFLGLSAANFFAPEKGVERNNRSGANDTHVARDPKNCQGWRWPENIRVSIHP